MQDDVQVTEAYFEAINAAARLWGQPLPMPSGVNIFQNDEWHIVVNNSKWQGAYDAPAGMTGHIDPYDVHVSHQDRIIIAVISPSNGVIGGLAEDDFIEAMRAIAPLETAS